MPNTRLLALARTSRGLCAVILVVCAAVVVRAQAPSPSAPPRPAASSPTSLPVTRVVLYKSGVGYFEHLGHVRGAQTVSIDFTSGQLDDALKSLTVLDLDGGRVLGVSYNSNDALNRRLQALQLPVGQTTTRAQLLSAMRGARIEVRSSASTVTGRLLSVETTPRASTGAVLQVQTVAIVSDAGEIESIALDPGVTVRVLDADLNQEVSQYLSLVASERDQDVRRLAIATEGTGDRDLFVSYISEVPVWKATYRLVLPSAAASARQPLLQGWAIVDNTVGEDWTNVQLSLVAGAPQSFVQEISRPYYVQRPIVPLPERVLLAPQTHAGALGTLAPGALAGTVADTSGGSMPGVTVRVMNQGQVTNTMITNGSGRYELPSIAPGIYAVTFAIQGFRTESYSNVVVSAGQQTVLGATMSVGSGTESKSAPEFRSSTILGLPQSSAAMTIDGVNTQDQGLRGVGTGGAFGGGGRGGAAAPNQAPAIHAQRPQSDFIEDVALAQSAAADAVAMGDLFQYTLKDPITIHKNQSALVPILSAAVAVDKVSLWSAGSASPRPLRALWLTNATGLTLDSGSFSVVDGQAFAGEGLMDSVKPGERRLLSYAIDLGMQVDAKLDGAPASVTKVQINHGVVIESTEQKQRHTYTARNDDTEARSLVIEHPLRAGWTVASAVKPVETTAAVDRFRVDVPSKTTVNFVVDETRPVETRWNVDTVSDDRVALLVRDRLISPAIEAALHQILAQKATVAGLDQAIASHEGDITSIGNDQERLRNNLQALKGSAEEKQLTARYVKQLDDQETQLATIRQQEQKLKTDRDAALAELTKLIENLSTTQG